jgi:cellulose synthase/poly-beta-1,6-N-acetylglucosamine synthase-like glycosyltransferase
MVSVLVAARNEEVNLPACLASLAAQDYPVDRCEFLIIDDGSTDRTGEIIREWAAREARFRLLRLEDTPVRMMGPKKRALAAGLCECRGEIVMITDADCTVQPGWVSLMTAHFTPEVSAVCGPAIYTTGSGFYPRLAGFEGLVNNVINSAVIGLGGAFSCSGSNFAYRLKAFINVGGFDAGEKSISGDDDLLLQRFRRAGLKIRFCFKPEGRILTAPPPESKAYWSRKRRHLSAGRRYALHWIILAAVVYLGFLSNVILGVLTLAGLHSSAGFLVGWAAFSLAVVMVFHYGLKLFQESGWYHWSIPAAILVPLWFVLLHPLTLLTSPTWKGRGLSSAKSKVAA